MSARTQTKVADDLTAIADRSQYIAFELGEQFYGVEISSVREIRQWSATTELPICAQCPTVRGSANWGLSPTSLRSATE